MQPDPVQRLLSLLPRVAVDRKQVPPHSAITGAESPMDRGTMEPLIRLFLLSLCFGGSLAGQPRLSQLSPSHMVGETVPRLLCRMSGSDIASHVLSWYYQAPGRGPVFLLSHRAGEPRPSYGPGVSERFIAALERDTNSFSLTIGNVHPGDAGTYYCAIWYASQYVFGEGTRLVVGGGARRTSEPRVALLGPAGVEHPAFVCVAWGFWPEPVRMRWRVGGQELGSGEVAPPVEGRDGASDLPGGTRDRGQREQRGTQGIRTPR
ncbi:immunoglobulin kappa light chain-like [Emydura macquarii macquarii]|uniref:immunoglobulin kappa light chain-like n=1 Tax=Emydura macquarii macquarii TaxID=1129001 RepID=UPI00352B6A3B